MRELRLEVPLGATVDDAWNAVVETVPALAPGRASLRFAVNGDVRRPTTSPRRRRRDRLHPAGERRARPDRRAGRILRIEAEPLAADLVDDARRRGWPRTRTAGVVAFIGRTRVDARDAGARARRTRRRATPGGVVDELEYEAFEPMALGVLEPDRGRDRDAVRRRAGRDRPPVRRRAAGRGLRRRRRRRAAPGRRVRGGPLRDRRDEGAGADLEGRAVRGRRTSGSATWRARVPTPRPEPPVPAPIPRSSPFPAGRGPPYCAHAADRGRRSSSRRSLARATTLAAAWGGTAAGSTSVGPGARDPAPVRRRRARPRGPPARGRGRRPLPRARPAAARRRDRAPVRDGAWPSTTSRRRSSRSRSRRATWTWGSRRSCSPSPTGARSRWPTPRRWPGRRWTGSTRTGPRAASCSRCSGTRRGRGSGPRSAAPAIVDALDEARAAIDAGAELVRVDVPPSRELAERMARIGAPRQGVAGVSRRRAAAWTRSTRRATPIPTGVQRALAVLRRFVDEAGARRRGYVRHRDRRPGARRAGPGGGRRVRADRPRHRRPDARDRRRARRPRPGDRRPRVRAPAAGPRRDPASSCPAGPLLVARTSPTGVPSDPATRAGRALALQLLAVRARAARRAAGRCGRRRRDPRLAGGRARLRRPAPPPRSPCAGRSCPGTRSRSSSRPSTTTVRPRGRRSSSALLPDAGDTPRRSCAGPHDSAEAADARDAPGRREPARVARPAASCTGTAARPRQRGAVAAATATLEALEERGWSTLVDQPLGIRAGLGADSRRRADRGVRPARDRGRPRGPDAAPAPARAGQLVRLGSSTSRPQVGQCQRASSGVPHASWRSGSPGAAAPRRPSRRGGGARRRARARRRSARTPCGPAAASTASPRRSRPARGAAAGRTGCSARCPGTASPSSLNRRAPRRSDSTSSRLQRSPTRSRAVGERGRGNAGGVGRRSSAQW